MSMRDLQENYDSYADYHDHMEEQEVLFNEWSRGAKRVASVLLGSLKYNRDLLEAEDGDYIFSLDFIREELSIILENDQVHSDFLYED